MDVRLKKNSLSLNQIGVVQLDHFLPSPTLFADMSSSPVPTIQQSDLEWTEDEDAVLRAVRYGARRMSRT